MPIFTQGEDYDEVDVDEEEDKKEVEDKEVVEEPEEKKEKKKSPPKKKKKQDKQATMKIVAIAIGATVLIGALAVAAISISAAKREAEAEQQVQDNFDRVQEMFEAGKKDPAQYQQAEPEEPEQAPTPTTNFSDKELVALRKWGYTASEIEIASRDGLSAKELVASAREDREEAQKEALAAVSDTASDEYKTLLNKTWLGQEPVDVSMFTSDIMYNQMTYTDNADFEKIEPHGRQCFLKVYLSDGSVAFMDVTPSRYNELPDSGNIVVEVYYIAVDDTWIITSITEKRVS